MKKRRLYDLIHVLSKSEKQYFHNFATRYESKPGYLEFFSNLSKRKKYDEQKIKADYGKKYDLKNYSHDKHYLYYLILKSMQRLYSEKTTDDELLMNVSQLRFLYKKGLIDQFSRELETVKEKAYEEEKFRIVSMLIELQLTIIKDGHKNYIQEDIGQIFQEQVKINKWIENETRLVYFMEEVIDRISENKPVDPEIKKQEIKRILLISQNIEKKGFEARLHYINLQALCYRYTREYDKADKYFRQALEFWDQNKHQIKKNTDRYAKQIANFLSNLSTLKRYGEFPFWLDKLWKLKTQNPLTAARIYEKITMSNILYQIKTLDSRDYKQMLSNLEEITLHEKLIPEKNKITLFYNAAIISFLHDDFENCQLYLSRIDTLNLRHNFSILIMTFVLKAILNVEWNNSDVSLYNLNSASYVINKAKDQFDFERKLVNLLKAFIREFNVNKKKRIGEKIRHHFTNEKVYIPPGAEIVLCWTKAKLVQDNVNHVYHKLSLQEVPD